MKSKLIAFSGGCHSGKTTTINIVKKELESRGKKVIVLNELLRNVTDKPIDELRKDKEEYYRVQKKIISEKINQEKRACQEIYEGRKDTVYFADRALSDSLFYLEHYVETSSFDDSLLEDYIAFDKYVFDEALLSFRRRYEYVIEFTPIQVKPDENDKYRPKRIDISQNFEYQSIKRNNAYFSMMSGKTASKLKHLDLIRDDNDKVFKVIIGLCEK